MNRKLSTLPWQIVTNEDTRIETADEILIAMTVQTVEMGDLENDQAEANAEFIVRACNAHHDLVAALEELLDLITAEYPHQQEVWLADARAALAKAIGK